METLKNIFGHIGETILSFLFPPICPGCGIRGEIACQKCIQSLESKPVTLENGICAILPYRNNVVRRSLWLLKYHNRQDIASLFGKKLHEAILEIHFDEALFTNAEPTYLVPIPISKERLRERGYNQAELIARAISSADTANRYRLTTNLLVKSTHTPRQAHLKNRTARLKNIQGTFTVPHPEKLQGKRIIIIDDITTTGATLLEAKRVLRAAGVKEISLWSAAH